MNPNPQDNTSDDFERQLARTPLKSAPRDWRDGILAAAIQAGEAAGSESKSAPSMPRPGNARQSWMEMLLLRLPLGWAGLAAVWAFAIFAGNVDRWLNGGPATAWVRVSTAQFVQAHSHGEPGALDGLGDPGSEFQRVRPDERRRDALPHPRSDRRRHDADDSFGDWRDQHRRLWLA